MYARQILGDVTSILELNCSTGTEPDLRAWNPTVHQGIIFDEGTPAMVLEQKKLFQAQAAWIALGTSTTNCHAYAVMVAQQRFIICSNTWLELLQRLSEADREWLGTNSVVVRVDGPLWLPGPPDVSLTRRSEVTHGDAVVPTPPDEEVWPGLLDSLNEWTTPSTWPSA